MLQIWDLWIPDAGATGVPFARGRLDPTPVLWVHSPPALLTVEVRSDDGRLLARAADLARTDSTPMTRLVLEEDGLTRNDGWPLPENLGEPVLLPGGEVGILRTWWSREDHSEWRWTVEFYNHR